MFGALDTSTSALVANRQWTESIAANLANQHATFNADGEYEPYRPKRVVFGVGDPTSGSASGVHVASVVDDPEPLRMVYDPQSAHADERGYRAVPNVSPEIEQMNMMIATRAYEANVVAAEATKSMMQSALRLIA